MLLAASYNYSFVQVDFVIDYLSCLKFGFDVNNYTTTVGNFLVALFIVIFLCT